VTQIQGEQRDGMCLSNSSNPDETVTEDDDEQVLVLNAGKTWERKCQICSGPNQPADHIVTECKETFLPVGPCVLNVENPDIVPPSVNMENHAPLVKETIMTFSTQKSPYLLPPEQTKNL